jgi:transposase
MLRAIAAAKKKNDRIDAGKIADCLRCNFLPECYMASTAIRERRRTLRYRNLLVRQAVQLKNKISGLLLETGVSYNKQKLHKVGYFRELLRTNQEITGRLRPLLKQCRENLERLQKTESALVRGLNKDPLLTKRVERLKTIPAVGPITALTWVLEIGDVKRFPSLKQAISYCGLCGDEKSSADIARRTPLTKQRNKHLQTVLVEAAKMAPRRSSDLAMVYEKEKMKGNKNRATLAVARKMVAYLLAVDRGEREFVPRENHKGSDLKRPLVRKENRRMVSTQPARSCKWPTGRRSQSSRGFHRIVSRLAGNTNSIFCEGHTSGRRQQMDVWFCERQEPSPRGTDRELRILQ